MIAGVREGRRIAGVREGRRIAGAGRRRGRRPAWIAVLVALAVFAAGCSGSAAGAARTPAPTTLAGYYAQRLDWQPCDDGFECARLLVPFDYARPSWRRFSLPVIKLPAAEESRRIGALVSTRAGPAVPASSTRSGHAASSRPPCWPGSTSWVSTPAASRPASPH